MATNKRKNPIKEFSRFADEYDSYNIIQRQVASKLIATLPKKHYGTIADIGCGTGSLFYLLQQNNFSFEKLYALDGSSEMLRNHSDDSKVIKREFDFNTAQSFQSLSTKFDLLLSASALQWSNDLDFTLSHIAQLSNDFHIALFASGTFKALHEVADIPSPIHSVTTIQKSFDAYFKNVEYEVVNYTLHFNDTKSIFEYMKKSGVSGGERRLGFAQTKRLVEEYKLDCLEFEVVFVKATN